MDDIGDADDGGRFRGRTHVLGLAEGGNFPAAIKAVAEWFPIKERALATGWFNTGTNVGAILCPIAVPWIFQRIGWEATFYVTGATGFVWVVAWWLLYDSPEKHRRLSPAELTYIKSGQPAVEATPMKVSWLSLLGYRAVWAYVFGGHPRCAGVGILSVLCA